MLAGIHACFTCESSDSYSEEEEMKTFLKDSEVSPVGQTDPFDCVVAVVHLVAGFKHDTEPPAAEALHRLEVRQVSGRRHIDYHHAEIQHSPTTSQTTTTHQLSDIFYLLQLQSVNSQ